MPSQSVEEYIEAIYRLGGESGTVSTGDLAASLGVAAPSVTTMLKRLVRDGLVEHTPYYGIKLTDTGRQMAASLIRSHRLSERLLTDFVGLPWDEVHEVACRLEHVITGDLADKVYQALGEPQTCPHGNPIAEDIHGELLKLSEAEPGRTVVIVKISKEDPTLLKYLEEHGIKPLSCVRVISRSPMGDVVSVQTEKGVCAFGPDTASCVWVKQIEEQE